eukprot:125886_1
MSSMMQDIPEIKLVVLGAGGVGKSALVIRFVTNNFWDEYEPTIEDSYCKSCVVDDKTVFFDILDTAGQEAFSSMQDQWMREGQVFFIVYSITSGSTFEEARIMREKILRCKEDEEPPIILIGNKCDLEYMRGKSIACWEKANKESKKPLKWWPVPTPEEGQEIAREWGENTSFYETSALNKTNLQEIYFEAYRLLERQKKRACEDSVINNGGGGGIIRCRCCVNKQTYDYDETLVVNSEETLSRSRSKLVFHKVSKVERDQVREPVLALKNFGINRQFSFFRFIKSILCGMFLPIIIIFQITVSVVKKK